MSPLNQELYSVDTKYRTTFETLANKAYWGGSDNKLREILYKFKPEVPFHKQITSTEIKEHPIEYFTRQNLINTNYHDLNVGDYERFYHYCYFYEESPKEVINSIMSGNNTTPLMLKGLNECYYLFGGEIELLAFKVLNMFPICKQINLNYNI